MCKQILANMDITLLEKLHDYLHDLEERETIIQAREGILKDTESTVRDILGKKDTYTFNIGGRIFTLSSESLQRYPLSLLSKLAQVHDGTEPPFIDRSPNNFIDIHHVYTDTATVMDMGCYGYRNMEQEFQFYGVPNPHRSPIDSVLIPYYTIDPAPTVIPWDPTLDSTDFYVLRLVIENGEFYRLTATNRTYYVANGTTVMGVYGSHATINTVTVTKEKPITLTVVTIRDETLVPNVKCTVITSSDSQFKASDDIHLNLYLLLANGQVTIEAIDANKLGQTLDEKYLLHAWRWCKQNLSELSVDPFPGDHISYLLWDNDKTIEAPKTQEPLLPPSQISLDPIPLPQSPLGSIVEPLTPDLNLEAFQPGTIKSVELSDSESVVSEIISKKKVTKKIPVDEDSGSEMSFGSDVVSIKKGKTMAGKKLEHGVSFPVPML